MVEFKIDSSIRLNKINEILNKISQGKVMALFLVAMFIMWLLTIITMKITEFPPDSFYYLKMLPIYYWIGLFIGLLQLYLLLFHHVKKNKTLFDSIIIVLFVLYLFGTGIFIYSNPQFLDTYGVIERINLTINAGHIIAYGGYDADYPLQIAFFSQSSIIMSSVIKFAKIFPLINALLISFFIYLIARRINSKYCLIAPIIYLSISWIDFQHISPQSYGLMLTSIFLFFLMGKFLGRYGAIDAFLLIIMIVLIQLAHPISPIVNILPLLAIWIVALLFSFSKRDFIKNNMPRRIVALLTSSFKQDFIKKDKISNILLFQVVFSLAYLIYIAKDTFSLIYEHICGYIIDFLYKGTISINDYTITHPMFSYILTSQLRKISLILIIVMGIICSIYIIKNSKKDNIGLILVAMFFGYISLFGFLLIAGDVTFIERGFVFSLLILPILIVKSISVGTKTKLHKPFCALVILFFIFSVFTFPVTYQGSGPYVVPSGSEISAQNFIINNPDIIDSIYYSYGGSPLVFNKFWYNYLSLKHNMGNEYIESFNLVGLNKLYDSGQSMVFFTSNNETSYNLLNGVWKYTSYR